MITICKSPHRLTSALLLSAVLAGCATGAKAPSPELQQQIGAASTRSDHESLAVYYDREAAGARASAAEHRRRAQSYPAIAGPRGDVSLRAHCNQIARNFDAIAVEYDGLARDHQGLATQAKP